MSEEATTTESAEQPQAGSEEAPKTFDAEYVDKLRKEAARYRTEAKANAGAAQKLADIDAANATDLEKAIAKARAEGKTEAAQAGTARLVNAEVRALAAEAKFRDPKDAIAQLRDSLADIEVNADGDVDSDAVKSLLAQLAKDKPYLLAEQTPAIPTPGQAGIGAVGGAPNDGSPRSLIAAGLAATSKK